MPYVVLQDSTLVLKLFKGLSFIIFKKKKYSYNYASFTKPCGISYNLGLNPQTFWFCLGLKTYNTRPMWIINWLLILVYPFISITYTWTVQTNTILHLDLIDQSKLHMNQNPCTKDYKKLGIDKVKMYLTLVPRPWQNYVNTNARK